MPAKIFLESDVVDRLAKLYLKGLSIQRLAEATGVYKDVINRHLLERGLTSKDRWGSPPSSLTVPAVKRAWAAGFFDGEGYIHLRPSDNHCNVTISASQVRPYPIAMLQRWFGGRTTERVAHSGSPLHAWLIHDRFHVEWFLYQVIEFLIVKNEEAIIALELIRDPRPTAERRTELISQDIYHKHGHKVGYDGTRK